MMFCNWSKDSKGPEAGMNRQGGTIVSRFRPVEKRSHIVGHLREVQSFGDRRLLGIADTEV
jgi:hypothetical protein